MDGTPWQTYLQSAEVNPDPYAERQAANHPVLRAQREPIQGVFETLRPRRIAGRRDGRMTFSVKLIRSVPGNNFRVPDIAGPLEVLGTYFHFDFEGLPPDRDLSRFETAGGTPIVQSYLLAPSG